MILLTLICLLTPTILYKFMTKKCYFFMSFPTLIIAFILAILIIIEGLDSLDNDKTTKILIHIFYYLNNSIGTNFGLLYNGGYSIKIRQ